MAVKKIRELNIHENPETNTDPVNVEDYINENYEKILDVVDNNADELIQVQGKQEEQSTAINTLDKEIKLNTDAIEENSKSIEELTAENTALKEELSRQKEDNRLNGLTEDNEGELVHIENTTGARFNSLEIFGNEKQDTRDFVNLYNVKDVEKNAGQNVGEEDFITLEKTILQETTSYINAHLKRSSFLKPNTNYWLVLEVKENTGEVGLVLSQWLTENNSQVRTAVSATADAKNPGVYKYAVTTMEDFTNVNYALRTFAVFNANTTGKIVFRVSLLEKEPNLDTFKYQKYGESPSFEFPSEVKAVGENANVFNDEAYKGFTVTQQNYNALEKVDLKLEANKYYVAKIYFDDGTSVETNNSNFALYGYKADGTQSGYIPNGTAKMYTNAIELVKAKIVANGTGLSTYANKVVAGIKIEEVADADGHATAYSKYGQGCIELKVLNKNFLDIQKNATVTKSGITATTDKDGVLTLNGTSTGPVYLQLNSSNIADNNISTWKKSHYKKSNYRFSVENLSATQMLNISAFVRESAYSTENVYATLANVTSAKTKSVTMDLTEDVDAVCYLWIASGITLNNAKLKFQIELDNATDIVAHEEQSFVIPVQSKMFSGDKFVKINGEWKEMHSFKEIKLSEAVLFKTDNSQHSDTILRFTASFTDGNLVMYNRSDSRTFWSDKSECVYILDAYQKECLAPHNSVTNQLNVFISKNRLTNETVEAFKQYLVQNEIIVYYKLLKPLYLDCTKEQIEVLDKIEKEAHTYLDTTNVYTEDEVGAIIKTNTNVDLSSIKETLDNIQKQIIA